MDSGWAQEAIDDVEHDLNRIPAEYGGKMDGMVLVPERLAKRIRLALDHSHRDTHDLDENGETVNNKLATELIACEGYPFHREPWE